MENKKQTLPQNLLEMPYQSFEIIYHSAFVFIKTFLLFVKQLQFDILNMTNTYPNIVQ